jgi:hypothetical protein
MRYSLPAVASCLLASACTPGPAQQVSSQQPVSSQQTSAILSSLPFNAGLTCDELRRLSSSPDKTGGFAILWLDGYYSARAGITAVPAGWRTTVAQGVGGNCAVSANASRPVLDVLALVHREYGPGNRPFPEP